VSRPLPLAAVALAVLLTLSGCVGASPAPATDVSPAPTADGSSPSQPVVELDPLETVSTIVVRPEQVELHDDSGAIVQTLSYDLTLEEFAAALAVVFDVEPTLEEYEGRCCESPPATSSQWEGFTVTDDHTGSFANHDQTLWIPEDVPDYRGMNLSVRATRPMVGDIQITTMAGFEVGDDVPALANSVGWPYDPAADSHAIPIEHGTELGPPQIEDLPNAYSVVVVGPMPDGTFFLTAPMNVGVPSV
jgi:hypothetical protein